MQATGRVRAVVFYDGWCPLCQRTVARLRRLDRRGVLRFHDFRARSLPAGLRGRIRGPDLVTEMHVYIPDRDRILRGFPAVRAVVRCIPGLWPLVPLFYLPGMARLGPVLYRWLARNRFRLTGCGDPACPTTSERRTR